MNAVGSYSSFLSVYRQVYFTKWGHPTNCLQAKGHLAEVNNEIVQTSLLADGTLKQVRYQVLEEVQTYLNQYIQMNCNDSGVSTIIDVPEGTPGEVVVNTLPGSDLYQEPDSGNGNNNMLIWAGAGVAIIYLLTRKRGRKN